MFAFGSDAPAPTAPHPQISPPVNQVSPAGISKTPAKAKFEYSALEKRRHLLARKRARNLGCAGETPGGHPSQCVPRCPAGRPRPSLDAQTGPGSLAREEDSRWVRGAGTKGQGSRGRREGRGAYLLRPPSWCRRRAARAAKFLRSRRLRPEGRVETWKGLESWYLASTRRWRQR